MDSFDTIIIGGGVVGCAIAREFSKYRVNALLIEKGCDVAFGTSGRNSGVAHAGFYIQPGTLKAKTNIKGHRILPELCRELDVPYKEIGKLVVAREEDEIPYIERLKKQGEENGTRNLKIIDEERIKELEPKIQGIRALYSPTSAILCPFTLTIALAENAFMNGIKISLNTEVTGILKNGRFTVKTNKGEFKSDFVINSAGLYADKISEMAGVPGYKIYPCRGEYHILDKSKSNLINHLVYPVPPKDYGGLGVHLTPTVHGNIMLGPSAEYIGDIDTANSAEVMNTIYTEAKDILPEIERRDFIRSFAGVRAKLINSGSEAPADFVIQEEPEVEGFINLVGIESPGLTAAPAIAKMVIGIVKKKKDLKPNPDFNPIRKGIVKFSGLPAEKQAELIQHNPNYGRVVCRCETITQQEVIDALDNPLGAVSINSIKNRCRAGMGRCQGGFCTPKIVEIIEEVLQQGIENITLKGEGSELFTGRVKDG